MSEIRAQLNYLHIAPRKARLVINLIRGLSVKDAEVRLQHLPQRASGPVLKLLRSAVANAKHNFREESGLFIREIRVDPGPVSKRWRARAFGRAAPLRKRTSHITLVLDTREPVKPLKMAKKKREGPMVREATMADVREEEARERREMRRPVTEEPRRTQRPGFVRRMFRRKAI